MTEYKIKIQNSIVLQYTDSICGIKGISETLPFSIILNQQKHQNKLNEVNERLLQ